MNFLLNGFYQYPSRMLFAASVVSSSLGIYSTNEVVSLVATTIFTMFLFTVSAIGDDPIYEELIIN